MFEWATAQSVKRLRDQYGPLAGFDDWLDGWSIASLRRLAEREQPASILVHGIPSTERSQKLWIDFERRSDRLLGASHLASMVIVAQMEPAKALAPPTVDTAFRDLELLSEAASKVKPGGVLAWVHYLAFPDDEISVTATIEPAAVLQNLTHRGFQALDGNAWGIGRIRIYNDPDTVFVFQQATLALWPKHRRITKVLCAMRKVG